MPRGLTQPILPAVLQTPSAANAGSAQSHVAYRTEAPLAFAGRSLTHRLVEVMLLLPLALLDEADTLKALANGSQCSVESLIVGHQPG